MIRFSHVRALLEKDLRDTFSSAQIMGPLVFVPLVIIVGYPTAYLLAIRFSPGATDGLKDFISGFSSSVVPALAGLTAAGRAAYLGTVYLFAGFFLIVPVMVSTVVAANSFAGEKERRTLEGLLYTPLTDAELVIGKILASFLPAIVFSWGCFAIYTLIVDVLGAPLVGHIFFPTPNWWALMLLLVPTVSAFVISVVVLISTRARGFQEANAIGGSIVLPIIGIVAAQASGLMVLSTGLIAVIAAVMAVLDLVLLRLIIGAFRRTRIVSYLP